MGWLLGGPANETRRGPSLGYWPARHYLLRLLQWLAVI